MRVSQAGMAGGPRHHVLAQLRLGGLQLAPQRISDATMASQGGRRGLHGCVGQRQRVAAVPPLHGSGLWWGRARTQSRPHGRRRTGHESRANPRRTDGTSFRCKSCRTVDFPAPEGPTSAVAVPLCSVRVRFTTAGSPVRLAGGRSAPRHHPPPLAADSCVTDAARSSARGRARDRAGGRPPSTSRRRRRGPVHMVTWSHGAFPPHNDTWLRSPWRMENTRTWPGGPHDGGPGAAPASPRGRLRGLHSEGGGGGRSWAASAHWKSPGAQRGSQPDERDSGRRGGFSRAF